MIKTACLAIAFSIAIPVAAFAQAAPAPVAAPATASPLQKRLTPPTPAPTTAAPAAIAPAAIAAAPKTVAPEAKSANKSGTKSAGAARRTKCSEEYQAAKKANTLAGQTWPKFYSGCNTRLKAAGQ